MEANMNQVILDTTQVALFPSNFLISNSYALADKLRDILSMDEKYLRVDTMFDKGGPADFVRVSSVLARDENIEVQLSPAKISIFWRNKESDIDYKILAMDTEKVVRQVVERAMGNNVSFLRVGYISTVFKTESNPTNVLRKILGDDEYGMNLSYGQLILTYNYDKEMQKIDKTVHYNRHVKLSTGIANKLNNRKVVIVEYDLNTRQDQNLLWNIDKLCQFINFASAHKNKEEIYEQCTK